MEGHVLSTFAVTVCLPSTQLSPLSFSCSVSCSSYVTLKESGVFTQQPGPTVRLGILPFYFHTLKKNARGDYSFWPVSDLTIYGR